MRIGQKASLSYGTCFLVVLLGLLHCVISSFKLLNLSLYVGIVLRSTSLTCIVWSYNRNPTTLVYASRVVKRQLSPDSVWLAHILMLAVIFSSWWQLLLLILLLIKGSMHIVHPFCGGLITCVGSWKVAIASHFVLVDVDVGHFLSSSVFGRFRLCPIAQIFLLVLVNTCFDWLWCQLVRRFDIILLLEFFCVVFGSLVLFLCSLLLY